MLCTALGSDNTSNSAQSYRAYLPTLTVNFLLSKHSINLHFKLGGKMLKSENQHALDSKATGNDNYIISKMVQ